MILDVQREGSLEEFIALFEKWPAHSAALKVAEAYGAEHRMVPRYDPTDRSPRGLAKRALIHPFRLASVVGIATLAILIPTAPASGISALLLALTFAGPMALLGFGVSVVAVTRLEQRVLYTHVAYARGLRRALAETRPPRSVKKKAWRTFHAMKPGLDSYRYLKQAWPQSTRVQVEPLALPFMPPKPTGQEEVIVEELSSVFHPPQEGQAAVSYPWVRLTRGERSLAFAHAGDSLQGYAGDYHLVAPCCGPCVDVSLPLTGPRCSCGDTIALPAAIVRGSATVEAILTAYLGTDPLETILLATRLERLIPLEHSTRAAYDKL